MASLYKKEVLIRQNSTISVQGAKDWTINWLNTHFQEVDSNKDENGNYINYFFADIFDSRDGNIYRVYTDACKSYYNMITTEFTILDNSVLAKIKDIPHVINDTLILNGDSATLTYEPLDGEIIGDEVRVIINETPNQTSYLAVDYTLQGKNLTIDTGTPGEFDGYKVKLSYLYSE